MERLRNFYQQFLSACIQVIYKIHPGECALSLCTQFQAQQIGRVILM